MGCGQTGKVANTATALTWQEKEEILYTKKHMKPYLHYFTVYSRGVTESHILLACHLLHKLHNLVKTRTKYDVYHSIYSISANCI